jgi:hypothetical protein
MNAGYAMGGQMEQQNNVAIQHQQLLHHSSNHAAVSSDSPNGDAVLARWLQSAGLQHLAAPLAAAALDHRLLPSLLMQAGGFILVQPSFDAMHASPPALSAIVSIVMYILFLACIISAFSSM